MRISLRPDDTLVFSFAPTPETIRRVRALPGRQFDPGTGEWLVPYTNESQRAARALGFDLSHLPAPVRNGFDVTTRGKLLELRVPWSPRNNELCRRIPDHRAWDGGRRVWTCKPTARNLSHIRTAFPQAWWSTEAMALFSALVTEQTARSAEASQAKALLVADADPTVTDYKCGGPVPFAHQRRAFLLSRDRPAFALLMEQRTGKTKVVIDTAAWLRLQNRIEAVVVIAPNGVKTNWVTDELPLHMPDYIPWTAAYWSPGGAKALRDHWDAVVQAAPDTLQWLVINVEALSNYGGKGEPGRLFHQLERFMRQRRVLLVVDESTRIKTPGAKRTRAALALAKLAPYRRILTGMPVTQGPLDIYAPFKFLDPNILGFGSYYSFRNHFAIMGGWNGREVVGFANLDELQRLIEPHSFRVLRDQCEDLPPKRYQKLTVALSPAQQRVYNQMRDEMQAQLGTLPIVTAPLVVTQLIRLQQIVGGFLPYREDDEREQRIAPIPGPNPKLEALLDYLEEETRRVIIWARFRPEIAMIANALRDRYGAAAVVEYHGGVNDAGKLLARRSFQDASTPVRFFVGQPGTGGIGITLTLGRTVMYYSNSFRFEDRKQSEDRPQGMGQTDSVTYVDIIAHNTVDDRKIIPSLRAKQDVANKVTGDSWREWI